jgi:sulfur-oxidizing protein SoxZ
MDGVGVFARLRARRLAEFTEIRLLLRHPMETGRRVDASSGALVPANYIERLTIRLESRVVADCRLGTGVAADPSFTFRVKTGEPGERVTASWKDVSGREGELSAVIE